MAEAGVRIEPSGVVLGRDSVGQPVLARIFGAEPVSVVFVGGWWAGQILVARCLAAGAVVCVDAQAAYDLEPSTVDMSRPPRGAESPTVDIMSSATVASREHWMSLDRAVSGAGRVRPMAGDVALSRPATAGEPLLRLHDVGAGSGAGRPPALAWHTQLTVLPRLTLASLQVVASAQLALIQRLDAAQAALAGSALLLSPEFVERFEAMDYEMVAAFRGPAVRYVWLAPTPLERQLFG